MQNLLNSDGPMRLKQCRRAPMLHSSDDTAIGKLLDTYGEFREPEVEILDELVSRGDFVVEVGANIGALTVPLAQFVGEKGHVIAFEPQHILFQNLCANLALNGLTNVRAINAAVGRESGSITLPKIEYDKPGVFGAHSIERATTGEKVQLLALDQYLRTNRCRLMKIDVEGMEEQVILGARTFIAQHKPVLYVENDRKEKSPSLIRTLLDMGYRLYWHVPTLTRDDNFFDAAKDFMTNMNSINMVCARQH